MAEANVAVLYVARGADAGLSAAKAFVKAWLEYPPEHRHQLFFLAKAWTDAEEREELNALSKICDAIVLDVKDDGFDWGAYFQALPSVKTAWVCLMNSHSRPINHGWLAKLMTVACGSGNGIAGATGSWESPRWSYSRRESKLTTVWNVIRFIKNYSLWRHFTPFPNPHLRSTGLVMKRELFELFATARRAPSAKYEAYILESGCEGLSRFAVQMGCRLIVVGSDGGAYEVADWPISLTFRSNDQQNLLISDNRTRDYFAASVGVREVLARFAWGRQDTSKKK